MYLMGQYHRSPALLKLQGKPVYYVYDSYRISPLDWAQMLCPNGTHTIRGTDYDGGALPLMLMLGGA